MDGKSRSLDEGTGAAIALLLVAAFFSLAFWRLTDWTLEDALIVARIARNYARHGVLSFNPSELVSSATSPLFALLVGWLP